MRLTTREHLSSSDARAAILSCHEELRGLLSETIHCADDATRSERGFEPLRVHARELFQAFEAHMDFEERILATALSDVIGWGSVLRSQVVEGHERQRATLARLSTWTSTSEPDPNSSMRVASGCASTAKLARSAELWRAFVTR